METTKPGPAPRYAFALLVLAAALPLGAQGLDASPAVNLGLGKATPYKTVERADLARYDNGKYVGHVYRETRGTLEPAAGRGSYTGTFFVLEETLRDLGVAARALDDAHRAEFRVSDNGAFVPVIDEGYPVLRGFPAYPDAPVLMGQKWRATFIRAVDPRTTGKSTLLPCIAEFEYKGLERYKERLVHRVFAKYAIRYKGRPGAPSPSGFSEAQGTHEVDIVLDSENCRPLLMRDRSDETFSFPDGSTIRFKGFALEFGEGFVPMDKGAELAGIRDRAGGKNAAPAPSAAPAPTPPPAANAPAPAAAPAPEPAPSAPGAPELSKAGAEPAAPGPDSFELAGPDLPGGVSVERVEEGIKLTVKDLRFAADSDALLPEEKPRLELLAKALGGIKGRTFLVEGHTAAVGKSAGEKELSLRRAKRIVDELVARGLDPAAFIYKGWGGTKPLAGNDSEAGRAKNRRVEITVLD